MPAPRQRVQYNLAQAMASVARAEGHLLFHASTVPIGAIGSVRAGEAPVIEDEDEDEDDANDRCPAAQMAFAMKCRIKHGPSKPFRHQPPPYGLQADLTPEGFYLQTVTCW